MAFFSCLSEVFIGKLILFWRRQVFTCIKIYIYIYIYISYSGEG